MLDNLYAIPTAKFHHVKLHNSIGYHGFIDRLEKSVDPDRLASIAAN